MSPAMIGTVPMYDAIGYLEKDLLEITAKDFLRVVEAHAQEGVDFMTIHAGINRRAVEAFMRDGTQNEHRLARRLAAVRVDADDGQ